ncbi:flavodoxin [Oceanobacillus halophilus]|uniref:Flavodoxin n=1 Tax=Oceanobacillus halophilus TaxID=930130 RepID=A0A495A1H9_9BACI|nr:flavodoxin [Oceanobacillus halophilus]
MRVGIVYTSVSGNTEALGKLLAEQFHRKHCDVSLYRIENFSIDWMNKVDIFIIGTYTWGNGDLPENMSMLYRALEKVHSPNLITGVFGTGDSFFPQFCGAVDKFRDLLKHKTNLAVTLKVELFPQQQDEWKCSKFVDKCMSVWCNVV